MKKSIFKFACVIAGSLLMTSCYTMTYSVGNGAQIGVTAKAKNHYLIGGLAPLKTSDPILMAGDTNDYEVTIKHSFTDLLVNAFTFGIYAPTTTLVVK